MSSNNGKNNKIRRPEKKLVPSLKGREEYIQKLRDLIEHVETYPATMIDSYSWQVAQVDKDRKPTGAAEWHLKALVIKPGGVLKS